MTVSYETYLRRFVLKKLNYLIISFELFGAMREQKLIGNIAIWSPSIPTERSNNILANKGLSNDE